MIRGFFGEYRFLSNFYEYPLLINGITFRSAENAFQSFKLLDHSKREELFAQCTPKRAKHLGRTVELRPDWEQIKLEVMYKVVLAKFKNTLYLRKKLILTGNQELVEYNHWGDVYWGVCENKGENHLGKILMRVREELYL